MVGLRLAACGLMVGLVSACQQDPGPVDRDASPEPCNFADVAAEVLSEPEVGEVPEDQGNLVLDLSSTTRKALRVTIRLNGKVALDVRTPSVAAECSHSPVYSQAFLLRSDSARVTVATDGGQRRSLTVPLGKATHWVAIQPQDGFPIGLDVFEDEPAWG